MGSLFLGTKCPDCDRTIRLPLEDAVKPFMRQCGSCGARWAAVAVKTTGDRYEVSFYRQPRNVKLYAAGGVAGLVQRTQSRITGTLVGLYRCDQADLDDDEGQNPWATICEAHANVCAHPTLQHARQHAADPTGWCEACQKASTASQNGSGAAP